MDRRRYRSYITKMILLKYHIRCCFYISMFIQLSSHKQSNNRRTYMSAKRHQCRQTQKILSYSYYDNGQKSYNAWLKNEIPHRSGGAPAVVSYSNGQVEKEEWYTNGKRHRPGGAPAIITYFKNGQIRCKVWYKDGELCRHNGAPAYIIYSQN